MPPRAKKTQVSVYLDPPIHGQLADYAARRSLSQSLVAEAAIASFLSPDAAEQREAAIAKRLDQADRRMARLERDVGIAVEVEVLAGIEAAVAIAGGAVIDQHIESITKSLHVRKDTRIILLYLMQPSLQIINSIGSHL